MKSNHRYWFAPVVGMLAAAATVTTVVVAQNPPGGPRGKIVSNGQPEIPSPGVVAPAEANKRPPNLALRPEQITKLPTGQRATSLSLPIVHGGLRIVPTGSVGSGLPPPPGLPPTGARFESWRSGSLDQIPLAARQDLIAPPYIPAGWRLSTVVGELATVPGGTKVSLGLSLQYQRDGFFSITIVRTNVGEGLVDITNPDPSTKHALTLSRIADVPIVIEHQMPGTQIQAIMRVAYVQKGIYTSIEAPAASSPPRLK